jgi:Sec-independent protein translocase protein TatA
MSVGIGELAVIFSVALVVLGPEKLTRLAKQLGQLWGSWQRHSQELKSDFQQWATETEPEKSAAEGSADKDSR